MSPGKQLMIVFGFLLATMSSCKAASLVRRHNFSEELDDVVFAIGADGSVSKISNSNSNTHSESKVDSSLVGAAGLRRYGYDEVRANGEVIELASEVKEKLSSVRSCSYAPHPTPTCILRNKPSAGCSPACSTSAGFGASHPEIFTGGPNCGNGARICTCNHFGDNLLARIQLARRQDGDPSLCALECQNNIECHAAFYRRWSGHCFLLTNCNSMVETWVGRSTSSQGGVTFTKPRRQLRIDPGENIWPVEYFGTYEQVPWTAVVNSPWVGAEGVSNGWDWSLPTSVQPAPRGLLTMERVFGWANDASRIASLPTPTFAVNAVIDMWVKWRDFEPDEGSYDFTQLIANVDVAASRGWQVGIRMLTSETQRAPEYLGPVRRNGSVGYNLSFHDTGSNINYDPADPIFHARYLALVNEIGRSGLCQHNAVKLMYVGYASHSFGDEGIGPWNQLPADEYPHVIERLQAWQAACIGHEWKMVMGGHSAHGLSLGFGTRNGFVEHYLYRIPDPDIGQTLSTDGYLEVNESAPVFHPRRVALGDENEEYERNWASEYRTSAPGSRGGPENLSAPEQGAVAQYGPLASFPYRYFMSSLRLLQMRISTLLVNPFTLDPSLGAFVALELGRSASDTPDAWCFLMQAQLYRGTVKNFERWLFQRDSGDIITVPEARITQTPAEPSTRTWMTSDKHDWIARSSEIGMMSFELDSNFMAAPSCNASAPIPIQCMPHINHVVKVTFFDVIGHGAISITNPNGETLGSQQPTAGDGSIKTATFLVGTALNPDSRAFQVRGLDLQGHPMEIVLSFVRVIKDI